MIGCNRAIRSPGAGSGLPSLTPRRLSSPVHLDRRTSGAAGGASSPIVTARSSSVARRGQPRGIAAGQARAPDRLAARACPTGASDVDAGGRIDGGVDAVAAGAERDRRAADQLRVHLGDDAVARRRPRARRVARLRQPRRSRRSTRGSPPCASMMSRNFSSPAPLVSACPHLSPPRRHRRRARPASTSMRAASRTDSVLDVLRAAALQRLDRLDDFVGVARRRGRAARPSASAALRCARRCARRCPTARSPAAARRLASS